MGVLSRFGRALGGAVDTTLVRPVRDGRSEPRTWHPSLQLTGLLGVVTVLVALAHVLVADGLRTRTSLAQIGAFNSFIPSLAVPAVNAGVFLAMTLVQTAALHITWPLRVVALLWGFNVFLVSAFSHSWSRWTSLAAYVLLLLFHVLRARRPFAGWELGVVGILVFIGTQVPYLTFTDHAVMGYDVRASVLANLLLELLALAAPALVVAGVGLTTVAITAGESLPGAMRTGGIPYGVSVGILLGLLLLKGYLLGEEVTGMHRGVLIPRVAGAGLVLALSLVLAVPFYLRARHRTGAGLPRPGDLGERYAPLSYLLAAGSTLWIIIPSTARSIITLLGGRENAQVPEWLEELGGIAGTPWLVMGLRCVTGLVLLVLAWQWARGGDWLAGLLLSIFLAVQFVPLVVLLLPQSVPLSSPFNTTTLVLYALLVAATAWTMLRRRLTGDRLAALLGAAFIVLFHDVRDLVAEPLEVIFGFSTAAMLVIGVAWRALTDGEFTRLHSNALPHPTRVMLFQANILLAALAIMYGALTRDPLSYVDLNRWEELGELSFADPVYIGAFLLCLGAALWGEHMRPLVPAARR